MSYHYIVIAVVIFLFHPGIFSAQAQSSWWEDRWNAWPRRNAKTSGNSCRDLGFEQFGANINLNGDLETTISYSVKRGSTRDRCTYFIGISKGSTPNYNRKIFHQSENSSLPLKIQQPLPETGIIKDGNDIKYPNNTVVGKFKRNGNLQNNHSFLAILTPPSPGTAAGTYSDTYTVHLYEKHKQNDHLLINSQTRTITFTYLYPKKADLALVSTGAPFDLSSTTYMMDFGVMRTDKELSMDIMALTNCGYYLNFTSENGGKMKHELHESYVDYTLEVEGKIIDFNSNPSSNPSITRSQKSQSQGDRFQTSVKLGSVENQLSGRYFDFITLTITTSE